MTPADILLRWYNAEGRDLPWRHTREAYSILVSEIMLQQTQVSRVITYYHRWMARFPTWSDLASASTETLIQAWSGLGYNRRALMLRTIAQHVTVHGEPQSEEAWRTLKGIGPYTAAALAAFSLKKRTLPIDTNIRRVLGRVFLGIPFPQLTDDTRIREATATFLPTRGNYFDIPQALFDLATRVCQKVPSCAICPLQKHCLSAPLFLQGNVPIPKKMIKQANEKKHLEKPHPDRIYRGRIVKAIQETTNGLTFAQICHIVDPSFDAGKDTLWMQAILDRLVKDQLLRRDGPRWRLAH